jgi:hypothetical protein
MIDVESIVSDNEPIYILFNQKVIGVYLHFQQYFCYIVTTRFMVFGEESSNLFNEHIGETP